MIHHLIGASPYTTRFLRLLEDHPDAFPVAEHTFWVEKPHGSTFQVSDRGRFRRIDVGPWGFLRAFRQMAKTDRVVIHQLSNPRLLLYLFLFRGEARCCAWSIWGGDVYFFKYRSRTFFDTAREFLRKSVIPSIPVVASMIRGDFETVTSVYGSTASYVGSFYPIPMDTAGLVPTDSAPRPGGAITLLVGNSGAPSNAHAWVLRALSRFRSEDVRIVAPLSYGNPAYVASVIALGRELFGDRFTPLTEFIPPGQYAALLREVDAAIMNHGFQQALGNIIAMLMMGKKVYVRSDTTPYRYFNDLGITVHDTLRVADSGLAEIVEFPAGTGERNAATLREVLSERNAVAGWSHLFETLRGPA